MLAELTETDWETVHVFTGSTPASIVNRKLDSAWLAEGARSPEPPIMVFVQESKVVEAVEVSFPYTVLVNGPLSLSNDQANIAITVKTSKVSGKIIETFTFSFE